MLTWLSLFCEAILAFDFETDSLSTLRLLCLADTLFSFALSLAETLFSFALSLAETLVSLTVSLEVTFVSYTVSLA
jgi:hypothetical protein